MIEINGLVAGYGSLDILRGVDLSVERGGITCIVGPNGAGKSTVLKAVSGVLRPKAGSVTIGGTDLTGRDPAAILRAGVAQVPQRNGLFTRLTVRQNVRFGLSLATHAVVLTAGTVALTGPAAEVAAHPGLMDLFFGDAAGQHGAGAR